MKARDFGAIIGSLILIASLYATVAAGCWPVAAFVTVVILYCCWEAFSRANC